MKSILKFLIRIFLSPWRWRRQRRDGVLSNEARQEIPNDVLLGLVRDMLKNGGTDAESGEHFAHHTATIWVKGYSMRPFLEHMRDRVVLAYPERPLQEWDAVLAEITPGHYVLHRIINIEGDNVTLMGDGNVRGTERCKLSDVCGIVTHYIRPKRTILATDEKLIRRIKRWRKWLRWRRYLLFLYKATV